MKWYRNQVLHHSFCLFVILFIITSIASAQSDIIDTDYYKTIINPDGSLTFRNKNTDTIILNSLPQYYLNYIQDGISFNIDSGTKRRINHTMVTNGTSIFITAIDNTNAFADLTHYYELDSSSPYVKYTVTIQYKQNVSVIGERFNFIVPDLSASVMTRDLKLVTFNISRIYKSDLYTPKVIKFSNGLNFLGSDTMESMELISSSNDSLVSFYTDYNENHPHFVKNSKSQIKYMNETQRSSNDTYSASITFAINTLASPKTIIKTRQPYGYDASLTFTNHADQESLKRIRAVAYGTEDKEDKKLNKGIVGRGLGWTKTVFVWGNKGVNLQDAEYKSFTDKLYVDGVEILGHTVSFLTDDRKNVSEGLQILSQYNAKNWIDHFAAKNWEDLASHGAIKGDENYILDILDQFNYKYAWSYIDLATTNYTLNMLQPENTEDTRPVLFYNNQIDDDRYDNKKIYLWSSVYTKKIPDKYYTTPNIDLLVSERGIHIGHDYMGTFPLKNHSWFLKNGKMKIYPDFDHELEYIATKKDNGLIWSPTMSTMGDYLTSLKDVTITYHIDGTYTVINNGTSSITGITLLGEDNIGSAMINNQSLVSFGGSYGDKEIVLPTLSSGQAFNINISYGIKDPLIPTIASNDPEGNRINEITGIWDDQNKQLTMTAQGSNNHSFILKIPYFAKRTVSIKDVTADTALGSYTASDTGEVTFSAPLGSLHTFIIGASEPGSNGNESGLIFVLIIIFVGFIGVLAYYFLH